MLLVAGIERLSKTTVFTRAIIIYSLHTVLTMNCFEYESIKQSIKDN